MGGAVYHRIIHSSMRYVQYYAVDIAVDINVEKMQLSGQSAYLGIMQKRYLQLALLRHFLRPHVNFQFFPVDPETD